MLARTTLATLALTIMMLMEPHSATAAPYWPWCSVTNTRTTVNSCAYISWEQCMDTVRGIGGHCYTNPYPPPLPARSPKHSRQARG